MEKTVIIIPAYNEEKRIGKTLEAYSNFFENIRKKGEIEYEILVSINNTTDKTKEVVNEFMNKNKRINYIDLPNGGKGYAVIEAFKDVLKRKNDLIGFVDADMATSPEEYWKLINFLNKNENTDGVIASRYINGAKIAPKPTLQRKIAKWMFNALVRSLLLIPYRDTQCGAKVFRRKAIETLIDSLSMSNWAFDVDLIYSAMKNNLTIKELPTSWIDKEYSKINFWSAGPWMAMGVIRLRLLNSNLDSFVRIYDKVMRRIR